MGELMPKVGSYEAMAKEAAARIDRDRERGQQLSLLPDEADDQGDQGRSGRSRERGVGRAQSQMREYLAARGFRFPEEVLAELAGLNSQDDVVTRCMVQAERMLIWAAEGADDRVGQGQSERKRRQSGEFTPMQRVEAFKLFYMAALRGAEALMPYGAAKVSTETAPPQRHPVVMPQAPSPAAQLGAERPALVPLAAPRMVPADVRHERQQNQQVIDAEIASSDGKDRTE